MPYFTGNKTDEKNNILILSAGRRVELVQDSKPKPHVFLRRHRRFLLLTNPHVFCPPCCRLRFQRARASMQPNTLTAFSSWPNNTTSV